MHVVVEAIRLICQLCHQGTVSVVTQWFGALMNNLLGYV